MVDTGTQLGAWAQDRTAIEEMPATGIGNDAEAPDDVRFRRIVTKIVVCRESHSDAEYERAGAFVFPTRQWFENRPLSVSRVLRLPTGLCMLTGKIFFINTAGNGYSLDYSGEDNDLERKLDSTCALTFPTFLYSPKKGASTLTWYPQGIQKDDSSESWTIADDKPTPGQITRAISRTYEGELITPDRTAKEGQVWENPSKGWAHKEAEARIQRAVRLTLFGAFLQCSIRPEQPSKVGRTDLEIVGDQNRWDNQIVHHAVLELKVLREKGSTGEPETDKETAEHMRKGLAQAFSYGEERNFRERMLCCFDMRAENAGEAVVFANIKDEAATLKVHLRHWFLYRSSEHLRQSMVAENLKNERTPPGPR